MNIPKFIKDIDWELLSNQKVDLLKAIITIGEDSVHAGENGHPEYEKDLIAQFKAIEGVIELIDSIQDYTVDELGLSEKEVFNFKD